MKKFNKQNLKKFAANLYKDDGKYVSYVPLCPVYLSKTINKEVVRCALGEMAFHFLDIKAPRSEEVVVNKLFKGYDTEKYCEAMDELVLGLPEVNDSVITLGFNMYSDKDMPKRAQKVQEFLFKFADKYL